MPPSQSPFAAREADSSSVGCPHLFSLDPLTQPYRQTFLHFSYEESETWGNSLLSTVTLPASDRVKRQTKVCPT